ncbi:hypothetical protein PIB30_005151 [Stylosanthes scabra]|uniref:Transmembrane protein n=1 Tax=Stylosanthes scabra TaxID=79078 RepID=A0ABU6R497_9FABA|nr:hypothetical protein [Stylosanthes scabra]
MGSSIPKLALFLLSLVVFINISNNHNYLAMASSSGGAMGGSFFHGSGSPSSVTFANYHSHRKYYRDSTQPCVVDDNNSTRHQQHARCNNNDEDESVAAIVILIFILGLLRFVYCKHRDENTVSLVKVQVAILGGKKGSSIQRDLTRIAHTSDTSSPGGVSKLLIDRLSSLHLIRGGSALPNPFGIAIEGLTRTKTSLIKISYSMIQFSNNIFALLGLDSMLLLFSHETFAPRPILRICHLLSLLICLELPFIRKF